MENSVLQQTNVKYVSRFIVDVECNEHWICLTDSSKGKFYLIKNEQNTKVEEQFKFWLENVFLKGVPQHITILKVHQEVRTNDNTSFTLIDQFCNI